jgi:hypothetical protein
MAPGYLYFEKLLASFTDLYKARKKMTKAGGATYRNHPAVRIDSIIVPVTISKIEKGIFFL